MSECNHNCSECSKDCGSRQPESMIEQPHEMSHIKKIIGVVSGKGGVGKSLITSLLAVLMQRRGFKTAILDADITGPSIPRIFGAKEKAAGSEYGIFPVETSSGIKIISANSVLPSETDPIIVRGPIIAGTVKQFWADVIWGDVDYMFVDMPPGTGDVPLTVFQSLPVNGIVIAASPQELVSMIVEKAYNMAKLMNIPILGTVENMSYFKCPDCGGIHYIFGESRIDETAKRLGIESVSKIPFNEKLAAACDAGMIELFDGDWLDSLADLIETKLNIPEEE